LDRGIWGHQVILFWGHSLIPQGYGRVNARGAVGCVAGFLRSEALFLLLFGFEVEVGTKLADEIPVCVACDPAVDTSPN
jgi:hypothetical protein